MLPVETQIVPWNLPKPVMSLIICFVKLDLRWRGKRWPYRVTFVDVLPGSAARGTLNSAVPNDKLSKLRSDCAKRAPMHTISEHPCARCRDRRIPTGCRVFVRSMSCCHDSAYLLGRSNHSRRSPKHWVWPLVLKSWTLPAWTLGLHPFRPPSSRKIIGIFR
jgi:hypothetical protein